MRLLVDIRKLSNKPSGIGIYIYNFIKELMNYKEIEIIAVTDVLLSNEILELKSLGLRIIEYSKEVNNNIEVFKYFKFVEKVIEREKIESFWEPNFIIPRNLKKKFQNVRFIVTVFDLIPITNPKFVSIKYRIYFKHFLKKTLKNIDSVIYISNTVKNQCESMYKFMCNKSVLMNYVIIDEERKENLELIDKNYFLFIGNIEERKGIRILLEAYKMYVKNGGDKKLKIAGSIRDTDIEQLINSEILNSNKRIEYLGYVDRNKKEELIESSSALIFPSYIEGFGIPPVEAIAKGKPIIVSDIEIFKEILEDSANYFKISDDFNRSALNLYRAMNEFKNNDLQKSKRILEKYKSKILTKKLAEFILIDG